MVHTVKLALYGMGDKTVLATDQQLREAGQEIEKLQRWFPQLQVSVEENDKTWRALSHNLCSVAAHALELYDADHPNRYMADHLHAAGKSVRAPSGEHALCAERKRATAELRAFNERIRGARALHSECVAALKEREYYSAKVEAMRVNEGRKKKVSEREVDRRLRNEMKLSETEAAVRYGWQRLADEVRDVEACKGDVLELVVLAFVRTQDYYFGRNPMGPTLAVFRRRPAWKRLSGCALKEGAHRRTACGDRDGATAPPPSEVNDDAQRRHRSAGPRLFSRVSARTGT